MIYSVVSLNDIFYSEPKPDTKLRSSNPYDYIRNGYYLDNGMSGGENYVRFKSNFSSCRTSAYMGFTCK